MRNTNIKMARPEILSRKGKTEFDSNRATLRDKNIFPPFQVEATVPLKEALKSGDVHEDMDLMLIERNTRTLALLAQQMVYHHVAQGEMAGEPWMVSL